MSANGHPSGFELAQCRVTVMMFVPLHQTFTKCVVLFTSYSTLTEAVSFCTGGIVNLRVDTGRLSVGVMLLSQHCQAC